MSPGLTFLHARPVATEVSHGQVVGRVSVSPLCGLSPPVEGGTLVVLRLDVFLTIIPCLEHHMSEHMLCMYIVQVMCIHLGEMVVEVFEPIERVQHQGHRQADQRDLGNRED